MDDLGFELSLAAPWFKHERELPYVLVRVSEAHARAWAEAICVTVRRCYVTDVDGGAGWSCTAVLSRQWHWHRDGAARENLRDFPALEQGLRRDGHRVGDRQEGCRTPGRPG